MWHEENRRKLRSKLIERHEQNIELEKKTGIKKEYRTLKTANGSRSRPLTQQRETETKFFDGQQEFDPTREGESEDNRGGLEADEMSDTEAQFRLSYISKHKIPKVTGATDRLAQPKSRQTPNPFDYADFRGLLHADYTQAVNHVTNEMDTYQRSTMRLLNTKPDSKLMNLLETKQTMAKGPDFQNDAPKSHTNFFIEKNKGFDRTKNS